MKGAAPRLGGEPGFGRRGWAGVLEQAARGPSEALGAPGSPPSRSPARPRGFPRPFHRVSGLRSRPWVRKGQGVGTIAPSRGAGEGLRPRPRPFYGVPRSHTRATHTRSSTAQAPVGLRLRSAPLCVPRPGETRPLRRVSLGTAGVAALGGTGYRQPARPPLALGRDERRNPGLRPLWQGRPLLPAPGAVGLQVSLAVNPDWEPPAPQMTLLT